MTILASIASGCIVGFVIAELVIAHRKRPRPDLAASVLARVHCSSCRGTALVHEPDCRTEVRW